MEHGTGAVGEIVGIHRVYPFPNNRERRWRIITELEDGTWRKYHLPRGRVRPQIGDRFPAERNAE